MFAPSYFSTTYYGSTYFPPGGAVVVDDREIEGLGTTSGKRKSRVKGKRQVTPEPLSKQEIQGLKAIFDVPKEPEITEVAEIPVIEPEIPILEPGELELVIAEEKRLKGKAELLEEKLEKPVELEEDIALILALIEGHNG